MPRKKTEVDDYPEFAPLERVPPSENILIDGQAVTRKVIKRDPLQLKTRLYVQIGELLHQLEGATNECITVRERIAALVAIARIQDLLLEKGKDEDEHAGSSIRKYADAFKKTNGAGRRTKIRGSPAGDKFELESIGGERDSDELDF